MNHIHHTLPDTLLKLDFKAKQLQSLITLILMAFLMPIVLIPNASATENKSPTLDGQKIWKQKCYTCHGDSDHIARNFLKVVDGKLQGPMHKETFRSFLTNHYLSKSKAEAVYTMLLTQATTKSRFETECSSCHQNKAEFVYKNLNLNNGILFSKKSGTPTYGFLETHRDLKKEDVQFFMKVLTLTGYEIYVPLEEK